MFEVSYELCMNKYRVLYSLPKKPFTDKEMYHLLSCTVAFLFILFMFVVN